MNDLFTKLYSVALKGDPDCGGMISYNYFSGEPVTGFDAGAPLFVRDAESKFTLANTMRMHLYSALATLKSGMDLMLKEEGVQVDQLFGHGGYFKTKGVGQRIAAAAMNAPVSVMETAGEGGAWGIAVLAAFLAKKKDGQSLSEFLNEEIFAGNKGVKMDPMAEDVEGFEKFLVRKEATKTADSCLQITNIQDLRTHTQKQCLATKNAISENTSFTELMNLFL